MEAISSLQSGLSRTMSNSHMDLRQHTSPQHSLLPQIIPLTPGRRFLPETNPDESHNMKRSFSEEQGKAEADDEELFFDIDEFLVEEDSLIRSEECTDCYGKECATIIAKSPNNASASCISSMIEHRTPVKIDGPIPDVANTNTDVINVQHDKSTNDVNPKNCCIKKSRKRTSSKSKHNSGDTFVPPKRPLSAYNIYFREERKRRIANADPSKKYNFEELGRLIGKGWRTLPLKEKRQLEDRAEADRERYRNEMIAYRREKRRRAREEDDQETLLFMQRHNSSGSSAAISSTQQSFAPDCFSPKRSNESYSYQRYVTISPGQRDFPQEQHHLYPKHTHPPGGNHIRKVSVSLHTRPYGGNNTDHRSVNSSSPAVATYESCSSLSGDEGRDERKNKKIVGNTKERSDSSATEDPLDSSNPSIRSNGVENLPAIKPPENPVARVVVMPATDGLQRLLQESRPAPSYWGHPQPHEGYSHIHHRASTPPPSATVDSTRYSPPQLPPPPLAFVGAQHYPPSQLSTEHSCVPQMIPMGMSIFMRDPTTGEDRSYRIQYTPKVMTQEEANRFQREYDSGNYKMKPP